MSEFDLIQWLEREWVSRSELAKALKTSPREARMYIAQLNIRLASHGKCILSSSRRSGYHIPSFYNKEDIALAKHAEKELLRKSMSILERRKVILNFINSSEDVKDSPTREQLTLF